MTHVDFFFNVNNRLKSACYILKKKLSENEKILIFSTDESQLENFDFLLWSFEPTSFIPHVKIGDKLSAKTPILISNKIPELKHSLSKECTDIYPFTLLINLDNYCPNNSGQFMKILEIVSTEKVDRTFARKRWKNYITLGYKIYAHDLEK